MTKYYNYQFFRSSTSFCISLFFFSSFRLGRGLPENPLFSIIPFLWAPVPFPLAFPFLSPAGSPFPALVCLRALFSGSCSCSFPFLSVSLLGLLLVLFLPSSLLRCLLLLAFPFFCPRPFRFRHFKFLFLFFFSFLFSLSSCFSSTLPLCPPPFSLCIYIIKFVKFYFLFKFYYTYNTILVLFIYLLFYLVTFTINLYVLYSFIFKEKLYFF